MKASYVGIAVAVVFLAIVGADIYLYLDSVPDNTITQVIITASKNHLAIPWFIGLLMGFLAAHWFDS